MKRYNIINNVMGWLCFAVALATYMLTVEPTASFWDCPEFISQGAKLEVGHPPGNPIFILTARFFVTLFGGGMSTAALAVNTMSALFSAATILLLFWTITHLTRRLIVRDEESGISAVKTFVIMCAGVCGALAYTWSDTFWFSAVEAEVYAFSSFCTALVFWLILKWENRADLPHSDRYLVLIAYVIGVSIAVHLLNLLCIPAIVLVFYYRKFKNANAIGSLIALGISFLIIAAVLYGLVPGFIKVAQGFELLFVNGFGTSYNTGVLVYAILVVASLCACCYALYRQKSAVLIKLTFFASIILSGIPFITSSAIVWLVLIVALAVYLFLFCPKIPVRVFNVIALSIFVIFIGYSSYALLLIRASANTPMNQNAPDNVFALGSYLNREQYGERPLFYGPTFAEKMTVQDISDNPEYPLYAVAVDYNGMPVVQTADYYLRDADNYAIDNGSDLWTKVVKTYPEQPDKYVKNTHKPDYKTMPDLNVIFPRIYSTASPIHVDGYKSWAEMSNKKFTEIPDELRQTWAQQGYAPYSEVLPYITEQDEIVTQIDADGNALATERMWVPSYKDNLQYFLNYQLNHMYWRYFMWNFAGRQNDIPGNGEPHLGNWISGIPLIDNARLGDQSLLPDEFGSGNKGHNVFFMLPLLLGIIGLLWQSLWHHRGIGNRGIEQFWVVFFLFFMTGIAIVLYLNQTPGQPRERDYAFAGSFYAFAIWIGMGIPALWVMLCSLFKKRAKKDAASTADADNSVSPAVKWTLAAICAVVAIGVPLQMVSQTWDDHDRSHRYTTRDFGMNYLNSVAQDGIIFCNGDNDTFPLWYAQEVEGIRTDVRTVNLSYLSTDWYANQIEHSAYEAKGVPMFATAPDYGYDRLSATYLLGRDYDVVDVNEGMPLFYKTSFNPELNIRILQNQYMEAKQNPEDLYRAFDINPSDSTVILPESMMFDLRRMLGSQFGQSKWLSYDIIAKSAAEGWKRPVYFASTVGPSYYMGLDPYFSSTGMALQVTPFDSRMPGYTSPTIETAYENVISKFRWGGLDDPKYGPGLYLDDTVRSMIASTRNSVIEIAETLINEGDKPASDFAVKYARDNNQPVPANRYDMARIILNTLENKMPDNVARYESLNDCMVALMYARLYAATGNKADYDAAKRIIDNSLARYAQTLRYASALSPSRRATMGNTARYTLRIPAYMLALDNYLQLAQILRKKPDGQDVLTAVNYVFSDMYNVFDISSPIYLHGIFESFEPETDREDNILMIIEANRGLGLNPIKATEDYAKREGIDIQRWRTL